MAEETVDNYLVIMGTSRMACGSVSYKLAHMSYSEIKERAEERCRNSGVSLESYIGLEAVGVGDFDEDIGEYEDYEYPEMSEEQEWDAIHTCLTHDSETFWVYSTSCSEKLKEFIADTKNTCEWLVDDAEDYVDCCSRVGE